MSIKVDMSTQDLDRQLLLLKYYPEFFKKHFRPALYSLTSTGKQAVLAGVPRKTGKAAGAVKTKVVGVGVNMEGHFGWFGSDSPWYINIVEHGAAAHPIDPRKPGGWLKIGDTYIRHADHKGFPARKFMAAAVESIKPVTDATLLRANEAVLKELEVK